MIRANRRPVPSLLRRARRDQRGGVAIMFSLSLLPLTLLGLGAVDYSRAISAKISLQNALDAAALAVARNNLVNSTQMNTVGRAVLTANLSPELAARLGTSSFVRQDTQILATANLALADTMIMPSLTIGAETDAKAAGDRLEVALVLDNTYSMVLRPNSTVEPDVNATKLYKLKVAAKSFLDRLESAAEGAEPGAVKVSLVPFSNTVNIGTAYRNATWLAGAGNSGGIWGSSAPNRFDLFTQIDQSWGGCVEARGGGFDVLETAPTTSNAATLYTPYFAPDEPDGGARPTRSKNDYLNDGRTGSRDERQRNLAKYATGQRQVAAASQTTTFRTSTDANFYGLSLNYQYGPNLGCRLAPLRRLTTDLDGLKTAIDDLYPVGETQIPIGLAWGWNTLSPTFPWPEQAGSHTGVAYNYIHQPGSIKTRKIVVLMTDGENVMMPIGSAVNPNESLYSGYQYGWTGRIGTDSNNLAQRVTALDSKVSTLCTNMKAQGIYIYTIRVEVTTGTDTVLRNCATEPDMYYDVQNANQLNGVFNTIAGRITRLRLAR